MSDVGQAVEPTADQIRADNADLDQRLLALSRALNVDLLTAHDAEGSWSAAQLLAHLGEFPRFFAADLRRLLTDPAQPVGRTVEHDERLAAVAAAEGKSLAELIEGMEDAFAEMAESLGRLGDHHVGAMTQNKKYGAEPLTAFLDRYVLGHKRAHLNQLRKETPAGRAAPAR